MMVPSQVRAAPTALALIVLLAGACKFDRSSPADALAGIAFFRGPDRTLMVSQERIDHTEGVDYGSNHVDTHYRLSAVDLATGRRVARVVLGDMTQELTFVGQLGGNLWFHGSGKIGLHARRPDTLQVVLDERDLVQRNPALSGGLARLWRGQGCWLDPAREALVARAADGRKVRFDAATLVAAFVPDEPEDQWRWHTGVHWDTYTRVVRTRDGQRWSLVGDLRRTIVAEERRAAPAPEVAPAAADVPVFLDGRFVTDGGPFQGSCGRAIESPRGHIFVVHLRSLGDSASAVVSAVDPARGLSVAWSAKLDGLEPVSTDDYPTAAAAGDLLVLVGDHGAVALDMGSGATRWTYRF